MAIEYCDFKAQTLNLKFCPEQTRKIRLMKGYISLQQHGSIQFHPAIVVENSYVLSLLQSTDNLDSQSVKFQFQIANQSKNEINNRISQVSKASVPFKVNPDLQKNSADYVLFRLSEPFPFLSCFSQLLKDQQDSTLQFSLSKNFFLTNKIKELEEKINQLESDLAKSNQQIQKLNKQILNLKSLVERAISYILQAKNYFGLRYNFSIASAEIYQKCLWIEQQLYDKMSPMKICTMKRIIQAINSNQYNIEYGQFQANKRILSYYFNILEICENNPSQCRQYSQTLFQLSEYYKQKEQYVEAARCLERALQICLQHNLQYQKQRYGRKFAILLQMMNLNIQAKAIRLRFNIQVEENEF